MSIDLEASASVSNGSDPMEYPDPGKFNLNDTHEQLVFMHRYEDAQQHDPSVKYAVVIFYLILVGCYLSSCCHIKLCQSSSGSTWPFLCLRQCLVLCSWQCSQPRAA